jgi:hypothetical protein
MAIISPLKKIFNWQLANEKIAYKSYVALLNQSGTDAPVATVLENTTGMTFNWSYTSAGTYNVKTNVPNSIPAATYVKIENKSGYNTWFTAQPLENPQYDEIEVVVTVAPGPVFTDSLLYNTPFEIRIYN